MDSESGGWEAVITYTTTFEADIARAALEQAGIPVMVKGADVGMFGGAFSGPTAHGVTLYVPVHRLEDASDIVPPALESE
jgi:hypothetical protein